MNIVTSHRATLVDDEANLASLTLTRLVVYILGTYTM